MPVPISQPWPEGLSLAEAMERRGVSRREFLAFCAEMSVILGLGSLAAPRVAEALQVVRRPSVIWLQLQECTGCVESVIRTAETTIREHDLDAEKLYYQLTMRESASDQAETEKQKA
jgi:Ni,Fe-hydrogenase I small subunit